MCIFPVGACSLFETVSHLAQAAVQLAVHSGPAISHSGSLVWPSQCWVPEVQHTHVSASFSFTLPSDVVNTDADFDF